MPTGYAGRTVNEDETHHPPRATSLPRRAVRAALLDPALYREVAADPAATTQALVLVTLIGLTGSIGAISAGVDLAIASALLAPVAWVVTAGLAQFIGTRVMGAPRAEAWERVARALGYAHAPAILGVFALLPYVGVVVLVLLTAWRVVAMVLAVRAAFGLSVSQATVTLLLSFATLAAATIALATISTPVGGE